MEDGYYGDANLLAWGSHVRRAAGGRRGAWQLAFVVAPRETRSACGCERTASTRHASRDASGHTLVTCGRQLGRVACLSRVSPFRICLSMLPSPL